MVKTTYNISSVELLTDTCSLYLSLFLKLTVHSTYTEMLQRNEHIKLHFVYTIML